MASSYDIRDIQPEEYDALGQLMVEVYANLEGFPTPDEQPTYYEMLAAIGHLSEQPHTQVLVAVSPAGVIAGGVVYFSDMAQYGSGGTATSEKNASGIRLLGVGLTHRGAGIGRALTEACIQRAQAHGHSHVILHTTQAMQVAWGLYRKLGFKRATDLDFLQGALPVFGFRLLLA